MKNNCFRDAMGQIDDRLLERCEVYEGKLIKKKRIWRLGTAAVAAVLAVIIGVSLLTPRNEPPGKTSLFTANDIAALFKHGHAVQSGNESVAVYAPDEDALGLIPVPEADTIPLYQCVRPENPISNQTIREFADGILPALAEAMEETVEEYTVDNYGSRLDINTTVGKYNITVSQYSYLNYFYINRFSRGGIPTTTVLNGKVVQADQTQTDEQIIAGLADARLALQEIFGVDFPDAKVDRIYNEESEYGAIGLRVYFYDEDAHPLNKYRKTPVSDNIELWFFNNPVLNEENCSLDVLQYVDISYTDWRTDKTEMYQEKEEAELLSLDEAEELLKKGYSFGAHNCELCYPILHNVDFSEYDAVSFTYFWNNVPTILLGEPVDCIPVYVFYKHIGTAKNGNKIYAETNVPAVNVSGLEDYFQGKH